MPSPDELLRPALAKIDWAEQHINQLARAIDAYLAQKPVRLVTRGDRKTGEQLHFIKEQIPVPEHLGLVAGDAVHNLRSSLDILVYSMIGDRPGVRQDRVEFPIKWTEESFLSSLDSGEIKFAGEHVRRELETLKPFKGGNERLFGLHSLDVSDKHRLILVVASTASMPSVEFAKMVPSIIGFPNVDLAFPIGTSFRVAAPKDGTRQQRRAYRRNIRAGEYERDSQPPFEICFGHGFAFYAQPVIPRLVDLAEYVRSVCTDLAAAFCKP